MNIINRKVLVDFKQKHVDVSSQIDSWEAEADASEWDTPQDIKDRHATASFVNKQVVFNLKGNKYRLLVQVDYEHKIIFIKKAGTHDEYKKWKIN